MKPFGTMGGGLFPLVRWKPCSRRKRREMAHLARNTSVGCKSDPAKYHAFDERLTEALATAVMGWRACPDRFVKSDRAWIPRWRFDPLAKLSDSFQLLEKSCPSRYAILYCGSSINVEVEIAGKVGKAAAASNPRAISLAVAAALGIEVGN